MLTSSVVCDFNMRSKDNRFFAVTVHIKNELLLLLLLLLFPNLFQYKAQAQVTALPSLNIIPMSLYSFHLY